jgi:hypothetical protein
LIKELPKFPNNCNYLNQYFNDYNFDETLLDQLSQTEKGIAIGNITQCISDIFYGDQAVNNLPKLTDDEIYQMNNELSLITIKDYQLIWSYTKHSITLNANLVNYLRTKDKIYLDSVIYDEDIEPGDQFMPYQDPYIYKPEPDQTTLYNGLSVLKIAKTVNQLIENISQKYEKHNNFCVYSIRDMIGIKHGKYIYNPIFTSCTFDPSNDIDWLIKNGQICCLMVIRIKPFDQYLLIGNGLDDLFYGDESEILLKAGTYFKILNTTTKTIYANGMTDFIIYYADYISDQVKIDKLNAKFMIKPPF